MPIENNLKTEDIAQIAAEEGKFVLGKARYLLGIMSVGFFIAALYVLITPNVTIVEPEFFRLVMVPILFLLSIASSLGTWRANINHNKLEAQNTSVDEQAS